MKQYQGYVGEYDVVEALVDSDLPNRLRWDRIARRWCEWTGTDWKEISGNWPPIARRALCEILRRMVEDQQIDTRRAIYLEGPASGRILKLLKEHGSMNFPDWT